MSDFVPPHVPSTDELSDAAAKELWRRLDDPVLCGDIPGGQLVALLDRLLKIREKERDDAPPPEPERGPDLLESLDGLPEERRAQFLADEEKRLTERLSLIRQHKDG